MKKFLIIIALLCSVASFSKLTAQDVKLPEKWYVLADTCWFVKEDADIITYISIAIGEDSILSQAYLKASKNCRLQVLKKLHLPETTIVRLTLDLKAKSFQRKSTGAKVYVVARKIIVIK